MKIRLFLAFFSICFLSYSQISDWTIKSTGTSVEFARAIAMDKQSDLVVAGYYNFTSDFDPGPGTAILNHWNNSSTINTEAFVAKYDTNGNYIWAKAFIGYNDIEMQDVAIDGNNNVITTGYVTGSCDFNPDPNVTYSINSNRTAAFISKLDQNGDFVFANVVQGCSKGYKVITDAQNNIYISGNYCFNADFDPDSNATYMQVGSGFKDAFVLKLDSMGRFKWVRTFSHDYSEDIKSMVLGPQGEIYALGTYNDSLKFAGIGQNVLSSPRGVAMFVTRINSNGNIRWAKNIAYGGIFQDIYDEMAIEMTSNGDFIIAGEFKDSIDYNSNQTAKRAYSYDDKDIFMAKLDPNGNVKWLHNLEGKDDQRLGDLDVYDDVILLSGQTYDSLDYDVFEPVIRTDYNYARRNLFIAEYDTSAQLKWMRSTQSNSYGFLAETIKTNNQRIYFTGGFKTTKDFDIGPQINNITATTWQYDFFLQKVMPCQRFEDTTRVSICLNDTLLWKGMNITEEGLYKSIVYDSIGCDSSFVLMVDHLKNDTTYTFDTICKGDSAFINSQYVYSTGIYQEVYPSSNGCDSISYIQLVVDSLNPMIVANSQMLMVSESADQYQWIDCATNLPLIGDTNRMFLPNTAGSYAVIVTINNCSDTSACFNVINVGLSSEKLECLKVYPNPTDGKLRINFSHSINEVRLFNYRGQLVLKPTVDINEIDLSQLERGLYLLQIETDKGTIVKKISLVY